MDKREIAAKITQKKEEIKNLIAQDNLEDAKKARKEMKDLQEKYDLLDEMEQEEGEGVKNQAAQGKVNEIKGKKSVVSALVNALRAGFKKKPVAKEDMEVLDAMKEYKLNADVIYACGPTPMLRALKAYAAEQGMTCYISMEERMACGIGACLACVCNSKEKDAHSNVKNKRICKEGPVFLAEEVDL